MIMNASVGSSNYLILNFRTNCEFHPQNGHRWAGFLFSVNKLCFVFPVFRYFTLHILRQRIMPFVFEIKWCIFPKCSSILKHRSCIINLTVFLEMRWDKWCLNSSLANPKYVLRLKNILVINPWMQQNMVAFWPFVHILWLNGLAALARTLPSSITTNTPNNMTPCVFYINADI